MFNEEQIVITLDVDTDTKPQLVVAESGREITVVLSDDGNWIVKNGYHVEVTPATQNLLIQIIASTSVWVRANNPLIIFVHNMVVRKLSNSVGYLSSCQNFTGFVILELFIKSSWAFLNYFKSWFFRHLTAFLCWRQA